MRLVQKGSSDKVASDEAVVDQLLELLTILSQKVSFLMNNPHSSKKRMHELSLKVMLDTFGFYVTKAESSVGGTGVVISNKMENLKFMCSTVKKGSLVGLYPGLLYLPNQPILLQSLGNSFIFKCEDGILIDGNDRGISKMLFRSCVGRDQVNFQKLADDTWLTMYPSNPLSIGQYINNQNKENLSNVVYQELIVSSKLFSLEERKFLPYLWYSIDEGAAGEVPLKIVAIVATRDIHMGEELFSDYFTLIT